MSKFGIIVIGLLLSQAATANPLNDLQPVGNATLKVYFWTIYDSALYTEDGQFRGVEPDLALRVDYRRAISREKFIKHTREEWQKQARYEQQSEGWLQQLGALLPDVAPGDSIVLRVGENLSSNFYLNGELIGRVADPEFTNRFLSIWLSEDSSYPRLRSQLVGG